MLPEKAAPRPSRPRSAWRRSATVAFVAVWPLLAGFSLPAASPPLKLAAASSYLECAARDLLGSSVEFVRLAEPGMCPGHFDLRPSQFSDLNQCRALLRFDFQKAVDGKLTSLVEGGMRIVEVTGSGGMGETASYLRACRELAEAFVASGLLAREAAAPRLADVAARVNACAAKLQRECQDAGINSLPVLASGHQKDFCTSLGLRVVTSFRAPDLARIREVDNAVQLARESGVKLVIANRPEGRRLADALAERLGAKVVEFANFPDPRQGQPAFDQMISANVRALLDAAR